MSSYTILLWAIIIFVSLVVSVCDIKTMHTNNWIIWLGCLLVVVLNCIYKMNSLLELLFSVLSFSLFYFLVRIISGKKLGMADVYFGIFQGLCLSWRMLPVCVFIEVFVALLTFFFVKSIRNEKIPFLPFMAIGLVGTDLLVYFL